MITVVAVAPSTVICMSTGVDDNTGNSDTSYKPGSGKDQEDPAKEYHFNIWDED